MGVRCFAVSKDTGESRSSAAERLGRFIVARREAIGVSQYAVHMASGLSQTTLSRIDNGHVVASEKTLRTIAPLLKLDYETLLRVKRGEEVDPATPAPAAPVGLTPADIEDLKRMLAWWRAKINPGRVRRG